MRRIGSTDETAQNVHVYLDGISVAALAGESIAGMMIARGVKTFRKTATGQARAPYCAMGSCFECRVEVRRIGASAVIARACMIEVEEGMSIATGIAANPGWGR